MIPLEVLEVGAVVALVTIASLAARRMAPHRASDMLGVVLGGALVATAAALALVAIAGLGSLLGWRAHPGGVPHHSIPWWLGLVALAALMIAVRRGVRRAQRDRRVASALQVLRDIDVRDLGEMTAFAVPGPRGGIVIDAGLWSCLGRRQRAALVAHEQAHLRASHQRHLRIANLAEASLPLLRRPASVLRWTIERAADEDAARRLGDRRLVAETVARVALLAHDGPTPLPAINGGDTLARVEALMSPPTEAVPGAVAPVTAMTLIVLAAVQVAHVAYLVGHLV